MLCDFPPNGFHFVVLRRSDKRLRKVSYWFGMKLFISRARVPVRPHRAADHGALSPPQRVLRLQVRRQVRIYQTCNKKRLHLGHATKKDACDNGEAVVRQVREAVAAHPGRAQRGRVM